MNGCFCLPSCNCRQSSPTHSYLSLSTLSLFSTPFPALVGLQCFEGMKAYRSLENPDSIHLFRPDMNMKRLENSMKRLHMGPSTKRSSSAFNHQELIECIGELCRVDKDFIPYGEGYSLYLRPTVIATHHHLGVTPPDDLLLYVITCPVGPYYKSGFKPIKLLADNTYVRAWPGGTGDAKVGGNYASTIKPASEASDRGYSQILWLYGPDDEVTEVGAMNVFFYLVNKDTGRKELVTAPLWRGDILPGVTRASILDLARWGRLTGSSDGGDCDDFDVSERFITMGEIVEAAKDNRLLEAFGAGTAAVVTPIDTIHYKGQDIAIPVPSTDASSSSSSSMTKRVWDELIGIQYRTKEAPPGWIVEL
jgi:branched-chain amino acid aminotransferase